MHSKRIIFFFLIFLLAGPCFGQLNPEFKLIKCEKNEPVSTTVKSIGNVPNALNPYGFEYEGLNINHISGNDYEMVFTPEPNQTGQVDIVLEYFDLGIFPGFPSVRYATYRFEIKASVVEASNEVIISDGPNVVIDALANDSSTDGILALSKIVYSEGGSAFIAADGTIQFSFEDGNSTGIISYIAEDENGIGDNGIVRVFDSSSIIEDDIFVMLNNKESIDFYLAAPDLELSQGPENGEFETSDWITFKYIPEDNYVGEDVIEFSDSNGTICTFVFTVVAKDLYSSFVVDDYVYTSVNESINFNVFDNDFRSDLTIIDYSPELVYLGEGEFSYTPSVDETGGNIYYYKIFSGLQFHEGNIFLAIDDYEPVGGDSHQFEVVSGNEFLIEHSAPISGYYFENLTSPLHGEIVILSAGDVFNSECSDDYTLEESAVIYLAEPGYEGEDAFELNYCTPGGNCHIVKIDVTVLADDGDCVCSADCVWPGDFNADGMVNMKDLMSFGLNVGQSGEARELSDTTEWNGFVSSEWGYLDRTLQHDLKHLDADGNGFVTEEDMVAFYENYGKQSKLISKDVLAITETPLVLSTTQTEVDSGEWLFLDVSLGDIDNPFIDFYSLAFQFNIDENLIDEESACLQMADGSWISYDSPLIDVFQQPSPGEMYFGISRLTLDPISGYGPIATFKFIVEDELDGFRDSDGKFILNLELKNAIGYNHNGQAIALTTNKVQVDLNLKKENENQLKVNTYPNPAADFVTIESNKVIDVITITDITGRLIESFKAPKSSAFRHDLSKYADGIYFIKAVSGTEASVHKVSHFNSN